MPADRHWPDGFIAAVDDALRALAANTAPAVRSPADSVTDDDLLSRDERRASAALLRVNHAGELAAQALYNGQALLARSERTVRHLEAASREERDHLAWCAERLEQLGGRKSALAPFWYAGSFAIGMLAGACGDKVSLGFVAETERQVEAHLGDHLGRLPAADRKSAAILERMSADESRHGANATAEGGVELPLPMRRAMAFGGELLRRIALRV